MAIKTYEYNITGQRIKFTIPTDSVTEYPWNGSDMPAGSKMELNSSSARIGCLPLEGGNSEAYKKGTNTIIMRYSFTTSSEEASKIALTNIVWTGTSFSLIKEGSTETSAPKCIVTTNPLPESLLNIWTIDGSDIEISSNEKTATASSIPIYNNNLERIDSLKPSTTYYIFVFDTFNYPDGYGQRSFAASKLTITTDVTTEIDIGVPSNFSAETKYVKPGGNLIVTWTAAKEFKERISKYTVTAQIGSYSYSTTVTNTATSATIQLANLPSSLRGKDIDCSIIATPIQTYYKTSTVALETKPKVNTLPTIIVELNGSNTLRYSSSAQNIKFTIKAASGDSNQSISIKCNGFPITLNGNIWNTEILKTTTYTFSVSDGVEEVAASAIIVTVMDSPSFSVSVGGTVIAPSLIVVPEKNNFDTSEYQYIIQYDDIKKSTNYSGTNINITDIRMFLPPDKGYYFEIIRTVKKNGIVDTSTVRTKSIGTTPTKPDITVYNKGNEQIGGLTGYFDDQLTFRLSSVLSLSKAKVTINGKSFEYILSKDAQGEYFSLSPEACDAFVRGTPTAIKVSFGYNNLFFDTYSSSFENYIRVYDNPFSNFAMEGFNIYEGTPLLTFGAGKLNESSYKICGFKVNPFNNGSSYQFSLWVDNIKITDIQWSNTHDSTTNNDKRYSLNSSVFLDKLGGKARENALVRVDFINDFGVIRSLSYTVTIQSNPDTSKLYFKLSHKGRELTDWSALLPEMELNLEKITPPEGLTNPKVKISISHDGGTWNEFKILTPIEGIFSGECGKLPVITKTTKIQFKLEIFNGEIEIWSGFYPSEAKDIVYISAPQIAIKSGDYDKDTKTIIVQYSFDNNNNNENVTITKSTSLFVKDSLTSNSQTVSSEDSISCEYDFTNEEFVLIYLQGTIKAIVNAGKEEYYYTISSNTPNYKIFNIMPTVSYRKNRLGINSKIDSDLNTILKISPTSNSNLIKMMTTNGAIVINLSTGTIDDIVIDCGTWGKT